MLDEHLLLLPLPLDVHRYLLVDLSPAAALPAASAVCLVVELGLRGSFGRE